MVVGCAALLGLIVAVLYFCFWPRDVATYQCGTIYLAAPHGFQPVSYEKRGMIVEASFYDDHGSYTREYMVGYRFNKPVRFIEE